MDYNDTKNTSKCTYVELPETPLNGEINGIYNSTAHLCGMLHYFTSTKFIWQMLYDVLLPMLH